MFRTRTSQFLVQRQLVVIMDVILGGGRGGVLSALLDLEMEEVI
jgi:hypothetical protein